MKPNRHIFTLTHEVVKNFARMSVEYFTVLVFLNQTTALVVGLIISVWMWIIVSLFFLLLLPCFQGGVSMTQRHIQAFRSKFLTLY